MAATSRQNPYYYISQAAITISPNAVDGDPSYVAVSVVTGTLIMLSVKHYAQFVEGLDYTADQQNPTWRLSGYSTKLQDEYADKQVYIYARLVADASNGLLVFSDEDYTSTISADGNSSDPGIAKKDNYIYVKLGYLTVPYSGKRNANWDSGCLLTQYAEDSKDEFGELFKLVNNVIKPLKNFSELTVNGLLTALNGLKVNGTWLFNNYEIADLKAYADYEKQLGTVISVTEDFDKYLPSMKLIFSYINNHLRNDIDSIAKGKITFAGGINLDDQDITGVDVGSDVPDGGLTGAKDTSIPTTAAMVKHVQKHGDANYLSKVKDDTAKGVITFENGLKVGNFTPGVADGSGGAMEVSEEGVVTTTTDYLNVRRKARFNDVEILTTHYIGGAQMSSAASCKTDHVVTRIDGVYQCFFRKTDADGRTITNDWKKGDQAYCNTFNLQEQADGTKGNHFFWRLVVSTDAVTGTLTSGLGETFDASEYHCLWIAMNNCAEGSDAPQAGDKVVLLGHQPQSGEIEDDYAGRQSAVYQVASGEDGRPYYRQYVGINSFTLDGRLEQQFMPGDNIFSGKVVIKSGSGWENLEDKDGNKLGNEFNAVKKSTQDALDKAEETKGIIDNLIEDGLMSPTERVSFETELFRIEVEYQDICKNAEGYNIESLPAYKKAYNSYHSILNELLEASEESGNVELPEGFDSAKNEYYSIIKETILNIEEAQRAKLESKATVADLSVSATNMLRNSGFYGEGKSLDISDSTILNVDTEMVSPSLEHWTVADATVAEEQLSPSGYAVIFQTVGASISQDTSPVYPNETYIVSFSGTPGADYTIRYASMEVTVSAESVGRTKVRIVAVGQNPDNTFSIIGGQAGCKIYGLLLERGTVASNNWMRSVHDVGPEVFRIQNLQYLANAIRNGSTTVKGGLILSNIIQLGNFVDGILKQVTSGVSGIFNRSADVALWSGGTFEHADKTVAKLLNNPFYNPTEEELAEMAKFVVTHGGTAILNEAIVRGSVYADNGYFRGEVNATSGTFENGTFKNVIVNGSYNRLVQYINGDNFDDFFKYAEGYTGAYYPLLLKWGDIIYLDSTHDESAWTLLLPYSLPQFDKESGKISYINGLGYKIMGNNMRVPMDIDDLRSLIGRRIVIHGIRTENIRISCKVYRDDTPSLDTSSNEEMLEPTTGQWHIDDHTTVPIHSGGMVILECIIADRVFERIDHEKITVETIGWSIKSVSVARTLQDGSVAAFNIFHQNSRYYNFDVLLDWDWNLFVASDYNTDKLIEIREEAGETFVFINTDGDTPLEVFYDSEGAMPVKPSDKIIQGFTYYA